MYTFIEAIEKVLSEENKPLSSKDIATIAIKRGYIDSSGDTPWKTINSKISSNILSKNPVFMRISEGVYGLKEWNKRYPEYQAKRYVKKLYDEEIASIPKPFITNEFQFDSEKKVIFTKKSFRETLAPQLVRVQRREAEKRYDIVQLVSVFIVFFGERILTHMRSARLPESRLHGEYSITLGGHLGLDDFNQLNFNLEEFHDDSTAFFLRELSEELIFKSKPKIKQIGYIYDQSRDVSSQHLGLVYSVELSDSYYEIGERGFLMHPKLETANEIEKHKEDFDNWSLELLKQINKKNIKL